MRFRGGEQRLKYLSPNPIHFLGSLLDGRAFEITHFPGHVFQRTSSFAKRNIQLLESLRLFRRFPPRSFEDLSRKPACA